MHYDRHRESTYIVVKTKAKALPSKALTEHFCHIKYVQLNSDVFTGIVEIDWRQMVDEYHHAKQPEGLQYTAFSKQICYFTRRKDGTILVIPCHCHEVSFQRLRPVEVVLAGENISTLFTLPPLRLGLYGSIRCLGDFGGPRPVSATPAPPGAPSPALYYPG